MEQIVRGAPSLVEILADDTSEGATQRDQFPKRIERYGRAKARAVAISEYITALATSADRPYIQSYISISSHIRNCGSYLVFRDYYTIGEIRLSQAFFCKKHLLCPLCAIRRGAKLLSRYLDRFHAITASESRLKPFLVTLTVKDGQDLAERFNHLQKSLRIYHKRRHGKRDICEAKKAVGAVWSYEIKRGRNSGLWHPHVHAVWLCHEPPSVAKIAAEWRQITGDSYIVDVRPISQSDPASGFLEVFKYAIKFSDQPESDTWHCYQTLRGRRLIGSFGAFYGVPEPKDLSDDPLEGFPYVERFFSYFGNGYRECSSIDDCA